jgi:hypothetical protein
MQVYANRSHTRQREVLKEAEEPSKQTFTNIASALVHPLVHLLQSQKGSLCRNDAQRPQDLKLCL